MDFTKPRVANYYFVVPQTGYRNDGPPLFLNANFRKVLNGLSSLSEIKADMSSDTGNVVHLFPNKENFPEKHGKFDLHVLVDHGEDAIGVPLDWKIPSPSAYWVSDAHVGYDYRLWRAKQMDYVFCCQKVFIDKFEKDGIPREKLFYLPHCVEPTAYFPRAIINRWDWAFVGHLNSDKRVLFLDRLMKEFPNWYYGYRMGNVQGWNVLEDAAKKYSQSKVVPNEAISEDLGMRWFEVMATKTALLSERVPDANSLFVEGKHYEGWSSFDEAVEKMRYLLNNDSYRNAIADAGYNETISKHTYEHRVKAILETTLGWKPEQKEAVHVAAASVTP